MPDKVGTGWCFRAMPLLGSRLNCLRCGILVNFPTFQFFHLEVGTIIPNLRRLSWAQSDTLPRKPQHQRKTSKSSCGTSPCWQHPDFVGGIGKGTGGGWPAAHQIMMANYSHNAYYAPVLHASKINSSDPHTPMSGHRTPIRWQRNKGQRDWIPSHSLQAAEPGHSPAARLSTSITSFSFFLGGGRLVVVP